MRRFRSYGTKLVSAILTMLLLCSLIPAGMISASAQGSNYYYKTSADSDSESNAASFEEAWTEANKSDGGVVGMRTNVDTLTKTLEVSVKNLTLELNGNVLSRGLIDSSASDNGNVITVSEGNKLTVYGGTASGQAPSKNNNINVWNGNNKVARSFNNVGVIAGGNNNGDGGGIIIEKDAKVNLYHTAVSGNRAAEGVTTKYGGGIALLGKSAELNMFNSEVSYNQADAGGGIALYKDEDTVAAENSAVKFNSAKSGGGIYINNEDSLVSGVEVKNNTATVNGGGIYNNDDNNTVNNITVTENSASGKGDGFYNCGTVDVNLAGKCVIKDNTGGENLYLDHESAQNAYIDSSLKKGSDVHITYGSDHVNRLTNTPGTYNDEYYSSDESGYYFDWCTDDSDNNYRHIYRKSGTKPSKPNKITFKPDKNKRTKKTSLKFTADGVNYEVERGVFEFCSDTYDKEIDTSDRESVFYYSDGYFMQDAKTYNEHLATLSSCMVMAAMYSDIGGSYSDSAEYRDKNNNIRQMMSDIGCKDEDIYINDYNINRPTMDLDNNDASIGVCISTKILSNGDDLVIVGIRGGGYEAEWASNVSVGASDEANGFKDAATKVKKDLDDYLERKGIDGSDSKTKFWIAGYSRAGATANLTAKRVVDTYDNAGERTFAYPIEAPKGGEEGKNSSKYDCIHNVINYCDIVPWVAPAEMGFIRYGVDHYVPGKDYSDIHDPNQSNCDNGALKVGSSDYKTQKTKMLTQLSAVNDDIVYDDYFHMATINYVSSVFGGDIISESSETHSGTKNMSVEDWLPKFWQAFQSWGFDYNKNASNLSQVQTLGNYWNNDAQASVTDRGKIRENYASVAVNNNKGNTKSFQQAAAYLLKLLKTMEPEKKDQFVECLSTIKDRIGGTELLGIYTDIWEGGFDVAEANKAVDRVWTALTTLSEDDKAKGYKTITEILGEEKTNELHSYFFALFYPVLNFAAIDHECYHQDHLGTIAYNGGRLILNHYHEVANAWIRSYDDYYTESDTFNTYPVTCNNKDKPPYPSVEIYNSVLDVTTIINKEQNNTITIDSNNKKTTRSGVPETIEVGKNDEIRFVPYNGDEDYKTTGVGIFYRYPDVDSNNKWHHFSHRLVIGDLDAEVYADSNGVYTIDTFSAHNDKAANGQASSKSAFDDSIRTYKFKLKNYCVIAYPTSYSNGEFTFENAKIPLGESLSISGVKTSNSETLSFLGWNVYPYSIFDDDSGNSSAKSGLRKTVKSAAKSAESSEKSISEGLKVGNKPILQSSFADYFGDSFDSGAENTVITNLTNEDFLLVPTYTDPSDFTYTVVDDEAIITGYIGSDADIVIPTTIDGYPVTGIKGGTYGVSCSSSLKPVYGDPSVFAPTGYATYCSPCCGRKFGGLRPGAFEGNTTIRSVTMYGNVKTVGDYAFADCTNLETVTMMDGVTSIGNLAFAECKKLAHIVIPESVESIGTAAFQRCTSLSSIPNIPQNIDSIGSHWFAGCTGLSTVAIPSQIKSIGTCAFANCKALGGVSFPASVTYIGSQAFDGCQGLVHILIPSSVINVGNYAFYNCIHLSYPSKTESIGYNNFPKDSAVTLSNPEVISKSYKVFFVDIDTLLYTYEYSDDEITVTGYVGYDTYYDIPAEIDERDVTGIAEDAFADSEELTGVTIPDTITNIGHGAFGGCSRLADITMNGNYSYDASALPLDQITDLTVTGTSIKDDAFIDFVALERVTVPAEVESIGENAFPDGIIIYGHSGSAAQTYADENDIPFVDVDETYDYTFTITDKKVTITGYTGSETELTVPETIAGYPVTAIGEYAFEEMYDITSITLPSSITSIGEHAFAYCTSLESINIPDGVTSIEDSTFLYCSSLSSITLPDSITNIGESAFSHCSNIVSVNIPDDVISIGTSAFNGCASLESITIPDGVTNIENASFYGCTSLTDITIPEDLTNIAGYAFQNCTSLESIVLPDSVTRIYNYAFSGCTSLTSITIPRSVNFIQTDSFEGSDNVIIYGYSGSFAESFANENNIPFVSIDTIEPTTEASSEEPITEPTASSEPSSEAPITEPSETSESTEPIEYTDESYFTYELYNAGWSNVAIITGYTGSEPNIIIPPSIDGYYVTQIGNSAFADNTTIESVTIPQSVSVIGYSAFFGCTNLTSITIPQSVTDIRGDVFDINSNLTIYGYTGTRAQTYADSRSIPFVALDGSNVTEPSETTDTTEPTETTELTDPTEPSQLVEGDFEYYIDWQGIVITGYNGSGGDVVIPEMIGGDYVIGIESGETGVFEGRTDISSISLPDNLSYIGYRAFYGCSGIEEITFPDSLNEIYWNAFEGCTGLSEITLSDNVTRIRAAAFANCTGLTEVTFGNNVTEIEDWAFSGCWGITQITLPDSMATIGDSAFAWCGGLSRITIPEGVNSIHEDAFANSEHVTIYGYTGSYAETYADTNNIPFVSIGDYVPSESDYYTYDVDYFGNATITGYTGSLTDLDIPSEIDGHTVTAIGESALYERTDLTSVTIPDTVTTIMYNAFQFCSNITSVTIGDGVVDILDAAFGQCTSLTSVNIPDSVENIAGWAFVDCPLSDSFTLGSGVETIGEGAFVGCYSITELTIPDGVTSIGEQAFRWSGNLVSVTIPESVTTIGENAFDSCDNLTIYGYSGSAAETYANENNIPFVDLDNIQSETTEPVETTVTTEPTEPAETSEPTAPTEPTESTKSSEPTESVETSDPTEPLEPTENPLDESYEPPIFADDVTDGNSFGLPNVLEYTKTRLLGVQKKEIIKTDKSGKGLRFVAEISSEYFNNDEVDYGFEVVKTSKNNTKEFSTAGGFGIMQNLIDTHSVNIVKASCKGTTNNIVGEGYGDDSADTTYKYVTLAINDVDPSQGVAVRFYVTIGGTTYYASYLNDNSEMFRGCCASYSVLDNTVK